MKQLFHRILVLGLLACQTAWSHGDPGSVEFFESKIRPVLVEHCQKCHSEDAVKSKKLRGGLKLDSLPNWMAGGDTGKAIVPGKPSEGTLFASLKYDQELKMPPGGKLPASVIADFENWIKAGAHDPRTGKIGSPAPGTLASKAFDWSKARDFWSFRQPVAAKITNGSTANPIDFLLQAKWQEKGLTPSGLTDKRTLIRRAYFDLIGLPPTPEEIRKFEQDSSPEAFSKVVDTLLTSPRYGERWARHWLDVARYAEDQAHTFSVKPKANAYFYRDWVIQAFNNDMPYDQFVKLQIAGDLMSQPANTDRFTQLAGLGFLGLGADYYKNTAREQAIAEELDDRVDTLTRGFLGLTVSCSRCHDHKFDPVPTRDYYSIAGIYYGTQLTDVSLAKPEVLEAYNQAQKKVRDQDEVIKGFLGEIRLTVTRQAQTQTATYLKAVRVVQAEKSPAAKVAKDMGLNRYFLERWVKYLDHANAGKTIPEIKDWFPTSDSAKAKTPEKPGVPAPSDSVIEAIARKIEGIDLETVLGLPGPKPAGAKAGSKKGKPNDPLAKAIVMEDKAPLFLPPKEVENSFLDEGAKSKLVELRKELDSRKKASPPAQPEAPAISGNGQGMKVYIRGNHMTKGEDAPKGFLQVLSTKETPQTKKDYSRLDLANAIASPTNPLTARVFVNRIWQGHFGRGLVNTPSNFGSLGERPTHPELLDHLAVEFINHGWSTKWLHRQILLSQAYQLSSDSSPEQNRIDPENAFLSRGNRHRLDIESWRDALLMVSGNLDTSMGGPTFDLRDQNARRRTVYAKISRHELNGLLRLFDFPDANVTADKRSVTTVPQQQLFALNSEFMIKQAKAFSARLDSMGKTDESKILAAYQLAYGRKADPEELAAGIDFLRLPTQNDDKLNRWQQYAQALLASNEFLYVD